MEESRRVEKEIVSVAELARMVGLSRARFYQLVQQGIFPPPARNPTTQRPFYDRAQQEQCLQIRRTNCGFNGVPVLFYARRLDHVSMAKSPQVRRPRGLTQGAKDQPSSVSGDPKFAELRHGLRQLGLEDVTDERIRTALVECFADGYASGDPTVVIMTVFRHLKRQNPPDNVSR